MASCNHFCMKHISGKRNSNCEIHGSTFPRGTQVGQNMWKRKKAKFSKIFLSTSTQGRKKKLNAWSSGKTQIWFWNSLNSALISHAPQIPYFDTILVFWRFGMMWTILLVFSIYRLLLRRRFPPLDNLYRNVFFIYV